MLLREKSKGGFYELRKRFKDNDPEGKGNVTREALARIIVTFLGRPLSNTQFSRLLERFALADKTVVSFTEFFAIFRDAASSEYPRWMDPVHRHHQEKVTMNAAQVHAQLKEKAKQRFLDMADLIPQSNPGGTGRLLKPEFRNALNKMMFFMDDDEFEKLWERYDTEGYGTIDGKKLMKKLGIDLANGTAGKTSPRLSPIPEGGRRSGMARSPRKKEADRQRSLGIENWLKNKFREGCQNMRVAFETYDEKNTGMVSAENFLTVLNEFGLKLEKPHLEEFLARANIELQKQGVKYREFLHRFQDRSEAGMPHKILSNPKHRYNKSRAGSAGGKSTVSALEAQIMNMFQTDFLALLGTFHKIDRMGTDQISQEEFRAAIESRFSLNMTDLQFNNLIDKVPLSEDGSVKYAEFMSQFDTRGKAPSLFEKTAGEPQMPKPNTKVDRLVVQEPMDIDSEVEYKHRTIPQLQKMIKDLLHNRYAEVENAFYELDESNNQRLSQELFYQLMKKFIEPEITRGEIRELWKTFILNTRKTLDYLEFVRHFGYNAKDASFPNAKLSPPKKGDSDFMMRSRKLNCAADMLQDSLRAKIDYMWEDLRRELVDMDPYATQFVTIDEFREILTELCVHLSDYELDMLCKKFETKKDGRINYVEFLKPFALKKQVWRHGNNMLSLLQHPAAELPIADIVENPEKGLTGLTAKLRQKLSGDWKNLRRTFKKLDVNNEGYLSVPEFRSVLKLANVVLDEEEVYQVMQKFDENMSGKIPYNKFLSETFKQSPQKAV
ncbi:EF-hand calcium-binding domain-containing protein 6 [Lingula anatina]|uniref:EF-hand calcium-binding domain-containing protein 6 n=1 Tax=Lingula anatina TaxID=7574 RepID=A0A2R2MP40_LINAN|nr:EF-hand calcium-binding domain-containing protein 6 [Lingula anatina]|eukprot:XP_023931994.1 EF-hand calcium-binding domain-containing protein 6 [Lingula anatina]